MQLGGDRTPSHPQYIFSNRLIRADAGLRWRGGFGLLSYPHPITNAEGGMLHCMSLYEFGRKL